MSGALEINREQKLLVDNMNLIVDSFHLPRPYDIIGTFSRHIATRTWRLSRADTHLRETAAEQPRQVAYPPTSIVCNPPNARAHLRLDDQSPAITQ
jgi:hypothetical protein